MGQYHEFENYGIDELKQHGLTFYKAKEKHRKLLVNHRVDKYLVVNVDCWPSGSLWC